MPEYVATEGRTGTAVAHLPALSTRRWIWISDEWQSACPQLARLVLDAVRGPSNKWVLLPTLAEFTKRYVDDAARPPRQSTATWAGSGARPCSTRAPAPCPNHQPFGAAKSAAANPVVCSRVRACFVCRRGVIYDPAVQTCVFGQDLCA